MGLITSVEVKLQRFNYYRSLYFYQYKWINGF